MKTITLGFSPCPNDTFIFDALVNSRIDTDPYEFIPLLADVEELNQLAIAETLDVTKISVGTFARVSAEYVILDAGSALGKGVGPILVSKNHIDRSDFSKLRIAIPGKNTTANLLLTTFFPDIKNKIEVLFSEIEGAILRGEADAGLLIHEGRFTYSSHGLVKLFDLGEIWESQMHIPLPLGCIAASRRMETNDRAAISSLIKKSVEFAFRNPSAGKTYIREHAAEMQEDIINKHIALYVNEFSVTLGAEGRAAIGFLLNRGVETGLLPVANQPIFNTNL